MTIETELCETSETQTSDLYLVPGIEEDDEEESTTSTSAITTTLATTAPATSTAQATTTVIYSRESVFLGVSEEEARFAMALPDIPQSAIESENLSDVTDLPEIDDYDFGILFQSSNNENISEKDVFISRPSTTPAKIETSSTTPAMSTAPATTTIKTTEALTTRTNSDDFNRQLIHSYGARGVALVRLLEEKEDTDEVCYEGSCLFHHMVAPGLNSQQRKQKQQHKC